MSIGTFLHLAHEEGLISNTSIHAGIRAPLVKPKGDLRNDLRCGFEIVKARDIDRIGVDGIIKTLKDRVKDSKVYVSVDIDVLDPAFAPGKLGGFTFRRDFTFRSFSLSAGFCDDYRSPNVCYRRHEDGIEWSTSHFAKQGLPCYS